MACGDQAKPSLTFVSLGQSDGHASTVVRDYLDGRNGPRS